MPKIGMNLSPSGLLGAPMATAQTVCPHPGTPFSGRSNCYLMLRIKMFSSARATIEQAAGEKPAGPAATGDMIIACQGQATAITRRCLTADICIGVALMAVISSLA